MNTKKSTKRSGKYKKGQKEMDRKTMQRNIRKPGKKQQRAGI